MEKNYKIIIIGAGITGLSTGLAWTKIFDPKKDPVIILEKHKLVGGCVSTFARKSYRFDTVQIIPNVSDILDFFEIDIKLKKFDKVYSRLFLANPNTKKLKVFPIASNRQDFENYLINKFPEDKRGINDYFNYCEQMYSELGYLKTEPKFLDYFTILFHCPKIIANSSKTYKQFLGKFKFKNPDLYEILDTFSSFSGLSGNRCAALLTSCAMISTLEGAFRPVKGFIQFPLELSKAFENNGGEIRLNTRVEKILIENGKTCGVRLSDGTDIKADYVISTADTKVTFGKLVSNDVVKSISSAYAKKLASVEMSPSSFAIHLGLDDNIDLKKMGFSCGFNMLTTGHKTHEMLFNKWEENEQVLKEDAFHIAVISPSVQTGGKPNLIIHMSPIPSQKWIELRNKNIEEYNDEKKRVSEFYINKVEEYMIPDLRNHIQFIDIATPATYARFIGSPTGSNFDMMAVPSNFGKNRLKTRTPIKNLFVPKFSHGIWPSMQAGLQVVDMISGGKIMDGNSSLKKKAAKRQP